MILLPWWVTCSDEEPITQAMNEMIESEDLIKENEAIYFPLFYYSEKGTASKLLKLMSAQSSTLFDAHCDIQAIEKSSGIRYDDVQIEAIRQAISSKVMVLTGGPGTG